MYPKKFILTDLIDCVYCNIYINIMDGLCVVKNQAEGPGGRMDRAEGPGGRKDRAEGRTDQADGRTGRNLCSIRVKFMFNLIRQFVHNLCPIRGQAVFNMG